MPTEQNQDLPGMEGRSIRALEDLAAKFVDLKKQRKALKVTFREHSSTNCRVREHQEHES